MNKKLFLGLFFLFFSGMTIISGCVSAGNLAFEPNVQGISASEANELNNRRQIYLKCLTVKAIEQRLTEGHYSQSSVKTVCAPLGERYYNAVYAKAFAREKRSDFSKNTARSSVLAVEQVAFKRISEEMK